MNKDYTNFKQSESAPEKSGRVVKGVLVLAALLFLIIVAHRFDLKQLLQVTLEWIESAGPGGMIVFFLLYVIATVFMVPGTILTLGAGVIFGVVKGSILVSLSSTTGAMMAFIVGRYILRGKIAAKIESKATFRSMDAAVGRQGWKIVGLARLSPVFPFNVMNYAFSLTSIRLKDYALASWIGMIPGTILYVYIGSLAGSIAKLGTHRPEHGRTPAEWTFYIVGLMATAAVTIILTRIAKRSLKQQMQSHPAEDSPQSGNGCTQS
ncbi:MAG: TVP38/TMEM64 family protein [Acidobacteriota bacterium]